MEKNFTIECHSNAGIPKRALYIKVCHNVFGDPDKEKAMRPAIKEILRKKTFELHERITRAIAESGFYLGEIHTTGL